MATFNPQISNVSTQVGGGEGKSRVDTSGGIAGAITNTIGTGLEAFQGLIKASEQRTVLNIEREARDEIDQLRTEFGVDSATDIETDIDNDVQPLPDQIQRQGKQLKNLTEAYRRGTLSASNYTARLQSVVRQLRANYPAYRDNIDQIVARETGIVPANTLISQLRQEASAASRGTNKLETEKLKSLANLRKYGVNLSMDTPIENIFEAEARILGEVNNIKLQSSRLALAEKQTEVSQEDLKARFKDVANSHVRLASVSSPSIQRLSKIVSDFRKDPNTVLNPEMLKSLSSLVIGAKQDISQAYNNVLNGIGPNGEQNGIDFNTRIRDRKFIEDERSAALANIDMLEQAVKDKDIGMLNLAMNHYEFAGKSIAGRLVSSNDAIALASALNRAVPNNREFASLLFTKDSPYIKEILGLVTDREKVAMITSGKPLIEAIRNVSQASDQEGSTEKGKAIKEITEDLINKVANSVDGIPSGTMKNIANALFNNRNLDIWNEFNIKQKSRMLLSMSNPKFIQKLWDMNKAGDVESWNNFIDFYTSSFSILNAPDMSQLKDTIENRPFVGISFDDSGNMIIKDIPLEDSNVAGRRGETAVRIQESELGLTAFAKQTALEFNTKLQGLRNIAKVRGLSNEDTKKFILDVLQQGGVNPFVTVKRDPLLIQGLEWVSREFAKTMGKLSQPQEQKEETLPTEE